jgi:proton glutamate symport protein
VALVVGFALGGVSHGMEGNLMGSFDAVMDTLGELWVRALRASVIPLVLAYVVAAVTSIGEARTAGRVAGLCFLTFAGLVALAAAYSVPVGYLLSSALSVDPDALAGLREGVLVGALEGASGAEEAAPSFGQTISGFLPSNIFQAAVEEQMLGLVLGGLVFGIAITRLEPESRELLASFFHAIAQAMMTVVIWVLWVMPLGVFCLAFVMARQTGWSVALAFGYWVFGASALLLGFILLLYLVASVVGRVPIRSFARAVAPAQIVAAGSRSSLACIPALLEGADEHLPTSKTLEGFVIPLSSATFKLSGPLGSPFQLFILAHLYGIDLDPGTITVFMAGILLMSFGTPGIPSGGFVVRLPFFMAAGIPVEGFMLTNALDAIPDIFKTTANVTGDMTTLTIVQRLVGGGVDLELGRAAHAEAAGSPATAPPDDKAAP